MYCLRFFQVRALLSACTHDYGHGSWYYKVSSRRMRNKEVQVIPWVIPDSGFVRCQSQRLDPQKTVFVGALHGMLNAEGLCNIFNDLFGGVVYAGRVLLEKQQEVHFLCFTSSDHLFIMQLRKSLHKKLQMLQFDGIFGQ